MKNTFVVAQKPFIAILSSMQPICTKRTTIDATSYIMFQLGYKELVLKSTDLEVSLQASYLLEQSNLDQPRSFLVSGRRIFDIVKELEGEITFTIQESCLQVSSDTIQLLLNIKSAHEFPPFPERIENLMQLDSADVLQMLNKVSFLIPQNNANPALNGLLLELSSEELKMTATDGHCLAQVSSAKYKLEEKISWLLPKRAIFEVKKILENAGNAPMFLGTCGNQLVFSGESFNFFTKLLSYTFPEYNAILDKKGFNAASVARNNFVKTLRRSACLLSGQFIATEFAFRSSDIQVHMQNKEVGKLQEHVPLESFEGEAIQIRFYAPYLLNGLQVFHDEKITFYLNNASKPIIFESQQHNQDMKYLVMPVSPVNEL